MKSKFKYPTREQWLEAAVVLMTPLFESKGYKVPKVRVSCGWPSAKACARGKWRASECWSDQASEDGKCQIFMSPRLKEPSVKGGVLDILVHEVVHAVVGVKESHNKVFGKCARAVGLEGKLTETVGNDELIAQCKQWEKKLGPYPHSLLKPGFRPTKKQTTRLVKCECEDCGYNVRVTRKWLDQAGAPLCPCNQEAMKFEVPKELEDENE